MNEQTKQKAYKTSWGTFRHFGKLEAVESLGSWVHLTNEDGHQMSMSKRYYDWAGVMQRAQMLIGKEIITETGSSSDPAGHMMYFRDIAPENDSPEFNGRVLENLPDKAKFASEAEWNKTTHEIITLRIQRNRLRFTASRATEENKQLKGHVEQMTQAEKKEEKDATAQLNQEWPEFISNPVRSIVIAGQNMNSSQFLKKIDVSFAMRMRIDVTKTKRLLVHVMERIPDKNKIRVKLKEFDDVECILAIKQSDHHSTKGEWSAATVENTLVGWWEIESKPEFITIKSRRATTAQPFFDAYDEIVGRVLG